MNGGYIKIFRQFQQWQHYQENTVKAVFLDLLLSVSYEPSWFKGEKIDRGCTAISISTIQQNTGLSRHSVINALKTLEESGEITREKSSFGCITRVNKFSLFQGDSADAGANFAPLAASGANSALVEGQTGAVAGAVAGANSAPDKRNNNKEYIYVDARAREAEWLEEILNSGILLESICKNMGICVDEFRRLALAATDEFALTDKVHTDQSDFKRHLLSTIRIKIREQNRNQNGTYQPNDRQAEREQLARDYAATIARRLAEGDAREAAIREQLGIPH